MKMESIRKKKKKQIRGKKKYAERDDLRGLKLQVGERAIQCWVYQV